MSFILRVCISSRLSALSPALSQARCYSDGRGHLRATEDYKNFRKHLTSTRAKLLRHHRRRIKMRTEDSGVETFQEASMEKEREQRAIEANEKELERMAEIRLVLNNVQRVPFS